MTAAKTPEATLMPTPTREERKSRSTALALESTLLQLKFRRKSCTKVRSYSVANLFNQVMALFA